MRPFRSSNALLLALLLAAPGGMALASPMVDAMREMSRAMSDYFDKRDEYGFGSKRRLGKNSPFGDSLRGENSDLYILYRNMPGAEPRSAASRTPLLDGIWLGRNGNSLMIRDGYLRLFASSYAHYQDAELTLKPPRMILRSLDGDWEREFDYAYHSGRLILRSSGGNLLLYRRLDMDRWQP
jgi:hypothetical protein